MKRALISFLLVAASFLLGWVAHGLFTADPQDGRQWRFVEAARRGSVREMESLSPGRERIDDEPSYADGMVTGFPALIEAASAGEPDSVAWLISQGADPNRQISDSCPLSAAEYRLSQTMKTIAILKENGAKKPE